MVLNLGLRTVRWQYLLAPVGRVGFRNAFRATVIGFAASAVLPARAGEFLREHGVVPDLVCTTDKQRTIDTADLVLEVLGVAPPRRIFGGGFKTGAKLWIDLGDVLVAEGLRLYELQRVGTKKREIEILPRGDR